MNNSIYESIRKVIRNKFNQKRNNLYTENYAALLSLRQVKGNTSHVHRFEDGTVKILQY